MHHLVDVTFSGVPGTVASSQTTKAWKKGVRTQAGLMKKPWSQRQRFKAEVEFRLYHDGPQEWDLDNLLKPFFDALTDVRFFGPAVGNRRGDERVYQLLATKLRVARPEDAGARLVLYALD